jgi:hypothetical protein
MYRIVTLGWAQMLLRLQQYLESGQRPAGAVLQVLILSRRAA